MLCLAICCSYSNAQADTSNELIDNNNWNGATYGADPGGCCASISGSGPLYDTTTGVIMFSYGQSTISQTIGLQQALGGTGIQVSGYNFGVDYRLISNNGNGGDTLTGNISLKNSSGTVVESRNFDWSGTSPTYDVWHSYSYTETFTNPYTDPQSITLQFTGKDGGFWAGYYGPELKNISLRATYSSDPCAADPLYSTSCAGYAQAYYDLQCTSNPLYDSGCPGYAQAYFDQQCTLNPLYDSACPSYASVITGPNIASGTSPANIATALSHSGTGITIYGFNYGFDWRRLSGKCYDSFLFFCTDYRTWSNVKPNLEITDAQGNTILSKSWNFSGDGNYNGGNWNSVSGSTIFYGTSYNSLNLGTADWDAGTSNVGAVRNYYLRPLMAPDQCAIDPLSNTACSGYAAAFLAFQCSVSSLYSPECPNYTQALQAMLDEQAALAAQATSTTSDPVAVASNTTTGSTPTVTEDATKDQTQVTTDVGGAELTTTGEVVVSDGIPSDVKESVKESTASTEKKEDAKTETASSSSSSDKKKSKVNAVALAQAAARDAEKTALSVAGESQAASLSDSANPEDGIGLGTGITIPGLGLLQGLGNANNNVAADNQALSTAVNRSRLSDKSDESQSSTATNTAKENSRSVDINTAAMAVEPKEEAVASTGPSVRRGGAVDGMSGGDMNSLTVMPANFNDYLTQQMQDAQFYASKEIYRGQRNVDNARALRGLGTDRLHQQMVEQQYNITGQ